MNVIELVEAQLKILDADGLCEEYGECGCRVGDLAPCGQIGGGCVAAKNDPAEAALNQSEYWMMPL